MMTKITGLIATLFLLQAVTQVQGYVTPCIAPFKYCDLSGNFMQIMDYQLFEGSISLFQPGFFIFMDETRSQFLNPNPFCSAQGYSLKQRAIQSIYQIANIDNRFDQNENPDQLWHYTNTNSEGVLEPFMGGVIPFQRCAYVLNMAYVGGQKSYNMKRFTISIEYLNDLKTKKTVLNLEKDYTFTQAKLAINHEDFPCEIPQFYFHPGINALMYMMDDQKTIVVKADLSMVANPGVLDMCEQEFLKNKAQIGQYSFDIKALIETSLSFKVNSIFNNWVFLNGNFYLVAYGYQLDFGSTTQQSMIVKVNIVPSTNSAAQISVVNMTRTFGFIDQIASLELMGFIYTVNNQTGIMLGKVNINTYSSMSGSERPTTTDKWKLYQARADNHPHRPIFAASESDVSKLYRVTSRLELVINDATLNADFYHFDIQVGRYRAMIVNPGTCGQSRTTNNYDNLRAFVLNLRRMEVERCIDLNLSGCGDGKLSARNDERCDDGNLEDGDGCSSTCQVENLWSCTNNEGQLSQCTPITCGNGRLNTGEECDDFNFNPNDGCTNCIIDIGYKCSGIICTLSCGDGFIQRQYRRDANGVNQLVYDEKCDGGLGCDAKTCKPLKGWTCTINELTMKSTCVQTCGNNKNDPNEVCDDGNNVSGDGCAEGCLEIEQPYTCPLVGKCDLFCGNGIFEGNDTTIGKLDGISPEKCDDGNNLDGDGCSGICEIEPGWVCKNKFQGLKLEIPLFKSECNKIIDDSEVFDTSKQYYRNVIADEFVFNNYAVVNQTTGKLRLIEHPTDETLFGVSFVANGKDPVSNADFAYEYTRVRQKIGGAITHFEETVDMRPIVNNPKQEAVQRNTFGGLFVKSTEPNKLSFYTYLGTIFQKFYTTTGSTTSSLLGSPEIYWWPKFKVLMARKIDGFDWETFKVDSNVVDVALNPSSYAEAERIETGGFKRDMRIGGQLSVEPIFFNEYMITYSKQNNVAGGTAQVLKYIEDIDYLSEFNEKRTLSEQNNRYFAYSLVYFGEDFGLVFKAANSSLLYRMPLPNINLNLVALNPNGLFSSENIAFLTFIQRRDDPWTDPSLAKDVYGYFDNQKIFKFELAADQSEIMAVEAIELPKIGVFIFTNRMIDIGRYQIVVYSGANCQSTEDITLITMPSAWFYTFSTKQWTCMDLNNTPTLKSPAWSVVTGVATQ